MTVQELINASACYRGCVSAGLEGAALLYLAQAFVDNGGGGGADENLSHGAGPPVAAPADPTRFAIYGDDSALGTLYSWNVAGQVWFGM